MKNQILPKRKRLRLKHYDYSKKGAYFVTICTKDRKDLFGEIMKEGLLVNETGLMIEEYWQGLPDRFPKIELDEFIIMPNHIHGIIFIVGAPLVGARISRRAGTRPAPTLGDIIGAFKSLTANEFSRMIRRDKPAWIFDGLWQRNYYEHIIRDENVLRFARQYILDNPRNWQKDAERIG